MLIHPAPLSIPVWPTDGYTPENKGKLPVTVNRELSEGASSPLHLLSDLLGPSVQANGRRGYDAVTEPIRAAGSTPTVATFAISTC